MRTCAMPVPRMAGPPPGRASLHEAALRYLARFAATEAGLLRVLDRQIARWSRLAIENGMAQEMAAETGAAARLAARQVAARLRELGVLNDQAFAEARARSLARAGRSRRAITAHLASTGGPGALSRDAAASGPDQELAAALIQARRRKIGPFGEGPVTRQALAALARAGFDGATASRALRMDRSTAEALIHAARQG
jgi:regulatory protein